jgi:hypothetical protein
VLETQDLSQMPKAELLDHAAALAVAIREAQAILVRLTFRWAVLHASARSSRRRRIETEGLLGRLADLAVEGTHGVSRCTHYDPRPS